MLDKLKTCRCCLSEASLESELHEFSSEVCVDRESLTDPQNFVKIGECFNSLTSVCNLEDDQSRICKQCLGELILAYIFQKKCLENEKIYSSTNAKKGELSLGLVHDLATIQV